MIEGSTFLIWFFAVGAIVGVLLGLLRKKVLYGLLLGLFFSVIGWAIILLGDDDSKNAKEAKLMKYARMIVGGILAIISIAGLIGALTSPIPKGTSVNKIFFTIFALVSMVILGLVVFWKGIKRNNSPINQQLENTIEDDKEK